MPNKQVKPQKDFSEYDISEDYGLYKWTDVFFKEITGVRLTVKLGSNAHLDSILDNNLECFLVLN